MAWRRRRGRLLLLALLCVAGMDGALGAASQTAGARAACGTHPGRRVLQEPPAVEEFAVNYTTSIMGDDCLCMPEPGYYASELKELLRQRGMPAPSVQCLSGHINKEKGKCARAFWARRQRSRVAHVSRPPLCCRAIAVGAAS